MTKPSQLVALFALVASCSALADVVWKNAGASIGPVTSINCAPDAGLFCVRDAGMVGTIKCNAATTSEPGCVTPSAQSFSGVKTFTAGIATSFVDAGVVNSGGCQLLAGEVLCPLVDAGIVAAGYAQADSAYFTAVDFRTYGPAQSADTLIGLGLTLSTGAGGLGQNQTLHHGGTGGPLSVLAGNGGASTSSAAGATGGNGGVAVFSSGSGGAGIPTFNQPGGFGGDLHLNSGDGGAAASAGTIWENAGNGGVSTTSHAAGVGGSVVLTAGNGGDKPTGTSLTGQGGAIVLTGGNGGAAATGNGGVGGAISIVSGAAGSGGNIAAGAITIDTGIPAGSGAGTISIGTVNSGSIFIGHPDGGAPLTVEGAAVFQGTVGIGPNGTSFTSTESVAAGVAFTSISAQTCQDHTLAGLTDCVSTDPVFCAFPGTLTTGLSPSCFMSGAATVTFRLCNVTSGSISPGTPTVGARCFH